MNYFGDLGHLNHDHTSYSLEGEDRIALSVLRTATSQVPRNNIFYLDIGCNQPINGSNTYLFYRLGFRGICIDPLAKFEQSFASSRPRDVFVNTAVASSSQQLHFVRFTDDSASSCHQATIYRYKQKFKVAEEAVINAMTIDDILSKATFGTSLTIPMVSLDIEGGELEIIEYMLNKSIHRYELFIVEDKLFSLNTADPSRSSIFDLLHHHGYRLIAKTPLNSFYVRRESDYFTWIPDAML